MPIEESTNFLLNQIYQFIASKKKNFGVVLKISGLANENRKKECDTIWDTYHHHHLIVNEMFNEFI